MRDAGKRLQVKPNKFVEWLRAAKYLNYDNISYQSHINSGYLVLSTTEHNGKPRTNTRVTGKGFAHFGKKIAELRFSKPDHNIFYK
jgi:phage antirepressor YoqD-like protein